MPTPDAAPPRLTLVFEAVERHYRGEAPEGEAPEVVALAGVSFAIEAGTVVAVVGPSGSGKSTLLNLAGGLDRPDAGRVRIDGQDLGQLDDDALTRFRRDKIGFIFQFFNLVPSLSALENAMLPALLAGDRPAQVEARALAALDQVGLSRRRGHRPDALSGGEMQRVAIARALVRDPPLVLADEPTGNLDSHTGEEVLSLLLGAAASHRTVVLVTHDPSVAARAHRVLTIRDGRLHSDERRA